MQALLVLLAKLPVWTLLLLSSVSVVTGDFFAKYWSLQLKNVYVFGALTGYVLSGFFFLPILRSKGLVLLSL